jgi:hypothetical protein
MICPQCQFVNESTSAFCGNCGARLIQVASVPDARATSGDPYRPARPSSYSPTGSSGPAAPAAGPEPFVTNLPPVTAGLAAHHQAAPYRLDLRRLSRDDQVVAGASLIVFISLFLPWFGSDLFGDDVSASGMSAHGYLVIPIIVELVMVVYLLLRAGWDEFPFSLPIAHAPLLLVGTALQFLLVLTGFADNPGSGLSWEPGAYLALIASVVAAAPVVVPAVRSWQAHR